MGGFPKDHLIFADEIYVEDFLDFHEFQIAEFEFCL